MSNPLVECIPNFSEARRPEVVEAILEAIRSAGVTVLDHHSDTDHNRTVVTYVGAPAAVEEAAFRGIQKAAELIDLDQHSGSHPRLGATDVVPFVPLAGVEMDACIEMARRLGERVGQELGIPVYLYEAAATQPGRVNLEDVRRGQYEALKEELGRKPERRPDFGPERVGPAGATVIGARPPLVAFNVYLNTDDIQVAKAIARAVRQSSGGFRYVKALGMLVDGRAQVSMNLTNFRASPVFRVVEAVRREASRFGVSVHSSELVGLIPQEALIDSAVWYLQLDSFKPDQVLENRLYETRSSSGPEAAGTFLDDLAAATPTPGGGSAAAYAGAMAAALVAMVARLTVGKKKYAAAEAQMQEILVQAERLRRELTAGVQEDSAAFEGVMAAFKLPKDSPEQHSARAAAVEAATLTAARVPLEAARKAVSVMALAERCAALGNLNAISDAASAAALSRASLSAASLNVRINVNSLAEKDSGEPLLAQLGELEKKAAGLEKKVAAAVRERGGLE